MNPLNQFLEKIAGLIQTKSADTSRIIEVIKKTTHLEIKPEELSIKEGIIYISGSPAVKSEIYMRKSIVLNELNNNRSVKIRDIR